MIDHKQNPAEGVREEDATRYVLEDIYLALQAQVEQLRESASEAQESLGFLSHHLRGRIGEAALMDMAGKADALKDALELTPTQCLSEIKAQAVREFARKLISATKAVDLKGKFTRTELKGAIEICIQEVNEANQLRQQAKAGE